MESQGFHAESLRVRFFRISKLRIFFAAAITLQLIFYVLQFVVFRAEAGGSTTYIILLVIGGLIIGIQTAHYRSYLKKRNPVSWHRQVLFIPAIVVGVNTFVFFTGVFSMLFRSSGQGVWEDAIPKLPPLSLAVFITTTVIVVPFVIVYALLSLVHYEFLVQKMKSSELESMVRVEEGNGDVHEDNDNDDLTPVNETEKEYKKPSAPRMRLLFLLGMVLQFIFYVMFMVSFEAVGGNSTTFVVILVAGCSVFVIQLYVARGYLRMIISPYWHADRLFLPSCVIWIVSCCYFAGNFTLLFKATGLGLWENILPKLSPLGLTIFILSILTIVPLIIIEVIIGHLHYRVIAGYLEKDYGVQLVSPTEHFMTVKDGGGGEGEEGGGEGGGEEGGGEGEEESSESAVESAPVPQPQAASGTDGGDGEGETAV